MARVIFDPTPGALARLAPDVAQVASMVIAACREAGWPVIIGELGGFRSPAEQEALYASGRTKPGRILTSLRHGPHNEGRAFDLDLYGQPREAAVPLLQHLGAWWKAQGLRWGGDWADYGHFEM